MNTFDDVFCDKSDRPARVHALVDGDIYGYKAASVSDGRIYKLKADGFSRAIFKYKSDAEKFCGKNGISYSDIALEFDPEPFSHCLTSLEFMYRDIKLSLQFKGQDIQYTSFLTGKNNFRTGILEHYKWNRLGVDEVIKRCDGDEEKARAILRMQPKTFEKNKGVVSRKPHWLSKAKKHIETEHAGIYRDWYEADDLMGLAAGKHRAAGEDFIIISIDKDLNCIPGPHYNTDRDEYYVVTDDEARYNFYYQCLIGDDTDNIPGLKGVGPATAKKLLDERSDDTDVGFYREVLLAWKKKHKSLPEDEVVKLLTKSAQCLWILQDHEAESWEQAIWQPPKL